MSHDRAAAFDLERIVEETFVEQVRYHPSIDSTNTAALDYCQEADLQTPLLVIAAEQTAGRGRGSNTWWSAAGALTFSLVLDPVELNLLPRNWPKASLTTGLAICLALDHFLPDATSFLKWPNDVYLQSRKLSGVLVEVGPRSSQRLILGIGINVNNSCHSGPAELRALATSMTDATGKEFSLDQVLICVLQQLEKQLIRLINNDPILIEDWQQRCALTGHTVEVVTESRLTTGVCQGIDTDGALLLQTEKGRTRIFSGVVRKVD